MDYSDKLIAMNSAASTGDISSLASYLTLKYPLSDQTIHLSILNKHYNCANLMLNFLSPTEFLTLYLIDDNCIDGLKYINSHNLPMTEMSLTRAAYHDYIDCFKLIESFGVKPTEITLNTAAKQGRTTVLSYMSNKYPFTEQMLTLSTKHNHKWAARIIRKKLTEKQA
jgi:hypothetical protein